MTAIFASIALIISSVCVSWLISRTPKDSPIWAQGFLILLMLATGIGGIAGLFRAAFT